MRFSAVVFAALALLATPIFGAPTTPLITVEKYAGTTKQGSYIVKLKDDVSKSSHLDWLSQHLGSDSVTHTEWNADLLNGFAGSVDSLIQSCRVSLLILAPPGKFSTNTLNLLRANPDVESISEDGVMTINALVTQYESIQLTRLCQTDQQQGLMHPGDSHV